MRFASTPSAACAQTGSSTNEFTCTGEQVDTTGVQYLRAGYHDPETGRFLGQDPLLGTAGRPQTLNRYPYVGNNPANYVDPSGLCAFGLPCPDKVEDAKDKIGDTISGAADTVGDALGAFGDGLDNLGYVDFNGTACLYLCVTGGIQASFGEGFHPYVGTGRGSLQIGGSLTYAPGQHISTGWSCGRQGSVTVYGFGGVTGQVGLSGIGIDKEGGLNLGTPFGEGGVSFGLPIGGPVAWSVTCYYVF